jgi:NAD(P)-dependent dehydrogenase (short-subunit alcohol dehydrogenase family)
MGDSSSKHPGLIKETNMEVRVDDKVLLVTGGAQGLGRAVAFEAARSGAGAIILTDPHTQRGGEVASAI